MRKGKYQKHGVAVKTLILILTLVLLVGGTVGGTLAWLTASSGPVVNTFTDSDIEIKLEETKKDFKMIPGWTIHKDPTVTVDPKSEDCWLFVKITESADLDLDAYIAYAIESGWEAVAGAKGTNNEYVIGRKVLKTDAEKTFGILAAGSYTDPMGTDDATTDDVKIEWLANQVGVKPSVTKQMMDAVEAAEADKKPTLTFQAYAVQLYKSNGVEFDKTTAWANAQNLD